MTSKEDEENLGSFYMGRMRQPPEPKRMLPKGLLTVVAVLGFAGLIWYAYPQGQERYEGIDVPVITADTTPYKSKPADPGGMDVPHRDSTVFESLDKKAATKPEKITSKQEDPLDKKKLGLDVKKPQLNLQTEMKPEAAKKEAAAAPPKKEEPKAEPAKPAVTAAAYVQLGAYKTEAEAKSEWARLQKKFPALKGLSMRLQSADLGPRGVYHRLQVGVKGEAQAKDVCGALKAGGAACLVVK